MSVEVIELGITEKNCSKCGCKQSKIMIIGDHTEYGECVECGTKTYCKILRNLSRSTKEKGVKCPYCNSFSTKKISTTSKVMYGATFGIFSASKLIHQWHCNNCKSDF